MAPACSFSTAASRVTALQGSLAACPSHFPARLAAPQFASLSASASLSSSLPKLFNSSAPPHEAPPFHANRVVAMAGTGKFFVGGNWKCNGNGESITKLVSELNAAQLEDDVDVVVSPPFLYLPKVLSSIMPRIEVAAQNCWNGKGGAFTGEISAEMLKDIGAQWVILGHSERRHILKETNQFIGEKQAYAVSQGLKVIGCVGELLEEREAGNTFTVVFEQLSAFKEHLLSWDDVVVAYEPVWAIGTGKVASPEQAQEVHSAIRSWIKDNVSEEVARSVRIIYGGSVNGANCLKLAKQEDIDGFLVGGASLKGAEFATICNSVTAKRASVV